jgi:hypothetical protein
MVVAYGRGCVFENRVRERVAEGDLLLDFDVILSDESLASQYPW